ncbi:hypothetical protein K1719_024424 [Acacia pycnantha]|nr:hypothetical protein K1719_044587 [Acacia pycnantha]KAI9100206.1 hypothetical protein K1719_024424 [Acacia pycnantha]
MRSPESRPFRGRGNVEARTKMKTFSHKEWLQAHMVQVNFQAIANVHCNIFTALDIEDTAATNECHWKVNTSTKQAFDEKFTQRSNNVVKGIF